MLACLHGAGHLLSIGEDSTQIVHETFALSTGSIGQAFSPEPLLAWFALAAAGLAALWGLLTAKQKASLQNSIKGVAQELDRALHDGHLGPLAAKAAPKEIARLLAVVRSLGQSLKDKDDVLARTEQLYRVASAVNRALALSEDEQALLNEACRLLTFVGGYRFACVCLEEGGELRCVAKSGKRRSEELEISLLQPLVEGTRDDSRLLRDAINTGRWQLNQRQARAGAPVSRSPESPLAFATAAFPLSAPEQVIGALLVCADEEAAFARQEANVLLQVAQDLAFALRFLRDRSGSTYAPPQLDLMLAVDPVTGVSNYAHFAAQLELDLTGAGRLQRQAALLVVGVHRLWEISDSLRLEQADFLLRDIGERLRRVLPPVANIARMRGDEFAVFLPFASLERLERRLRNLVQILREPLTVGSFQIEIDTSIGYALYPLDGDAIDRLARNADVAMRRAKVERQALVRFDALQDEKGRQRLVLAHELRRALEANELALHYQPKVDVQTGRVCGAEALIRWKHPMRGLVPPDEFIAVAEQTGLIGEITAWVIQRSLRDAIRWRHAGLTFPVAVNLSPRDLRDRSLPSKILAWLKECGADGSWLELEITEGAVIEDPKGALSVLEQLSDLGVALYIDDFGTGYSSLGYLKQLPVDAIKIDKSFIIDMLTDSDSVVIVRSIIGLAHELGLKVVAEGVENEATWKELVGLGCDIVQGFYIGRPVSSAALLERAKQQ